MMNSVSPASPSPPPFVAATPDGAAAAADGPAAFAKALDRAAQARGSQADRPPQHTLRDNNTEPDTPSTAERAARGKRTQRTPPTQPREGAATQSREAAEEGLPQAESKALLQPQDDAPGDAAAQALLDLAGLMAGLAQATRGTAATGEAARDSAQEDTTASCTAAQPHGGKPAAAQANALLTHGQDVLLAARKGNESGVLTPAGDAVAAAAMLRDGGSPRQVFDSAIGGPRAQMAGAAPATTPAPIAGGEPAAMFRAELAAALGTPEFASALGAQVSVLIRDGLSQAQLHLNPADMGPIEVRIRLDGDNAQVDFSALQAMTRQALEDAVPALASALRESGLTLSGGGVFEQTRQPQGEQPGSRAPGATPAPKDATDPAPTRGAVARAFHARGMVDLYA